MSCGIIIIVKSAWCADISNFQDDFNDWWLRYLLYVSNTYWGMHAYVILLLHCCYDRFSTSINGPKFGVDISFEITYIFLPNHFLFQNGSNNQYVNIGISSNVFAWKPHVMDMETLSAVLVFCEGKSPVTGGFPHKRPVKVGLGVSLILDRSNCSTNPRFAGNLERHEAHVISP